jgi:hydrogenase-4 component E
MNWGIELAADFLILSNLALLGMSHLRNSIRLVGLQGAVFALALVWQGSQASGVVMVGLIEAILKGFVFPAVLMHSIREINTGREQRPFLGFGTSVVLGVILLGISLWLGRSLSQMQGLKNSLLLSASVMNVLCGLALVVGRKMAIFQVLGYLVMSTGLAVFGIALLGDLPLFIEWGLLLDTCLGVGVMAAAIYLINREFAHIETYQLSFLKG